MTDPRISTISDRLKGVRNVIAISSGKGGVGKSLVASTLALALVKKGYRVGLFDLDFTSPSTHIILGVKSVKPREEKGIVPPRVHGLEYMSIVYYSGDHASPLRGVDVSNAFIELLSVARWGKLDFLLLDMPPGIGDATLDLIRLIRRVKFIIVTTPSQLAFETVKKLANLLGGLGIPVIGVVENMKMDQSKSIHERVKRMGTAFLGGIPFDSLVEESIGDVRKLAKTVFAKKVERIAGKI